VFQKGQEWRAACSLDQQYVGHYRAVHLPSSIVLRCSELPGVRMASIGKDLSDGKTKRLNDLPARKRHSPVQNIVRHFHLRPLVRTDQAPHDFDQYELSGANFGSSVTHIREIP